MTGKDMMLALVGAAVVGGAAGAAASIFVAGKAEAPAAEPSSDVLYRLKIAEDELAKTRTALDDSTKSIHELQERVTSSELKAANAAAADSAATASLPGRGFRVARPARAAGEPGAIDFVGHPAGSFEFDDAGGQIAVELGKALDGLSGELGGLETNLAGFRAGMELRKLPEAERWQKAKDDLGLTWNQVEELKKAVTDRDTAMKDATNVERKTGPSGGTITIERPDAAKSAHAEANYHDKVNATLSEDQRKSWSGKGYDRAFGQRPFGGMGGSMVMAIDVKSDSKSDRQGDAPKDAPK